MPPVIVDLGRNCTISVGGVALEGVRGVSVSTSREEIDVKPFASAEAYTLTAHRTITLEVETINRSDATLLKNAIDNPNAGVVIAASNASGTFAVVSLSASEPLDDVVVYTATLKRTFASA